MVGLIGTSQVIVPIRIMQQRRQYKPRSPGREPPYPLASLSCMTCLRWLPGQDMYTVVKGILKDVLYSKGYPTGAAQQQMSDSKVVAFKYAPKQLNASTVLRSCKASSTVNVQKTTTGVMTSNSRVTSITFQINYLSAFYGFRHIGKL